MPAYRELEPGLYELDTPSGPLPVTSTEDELRAAGHFPASLSLFNAGATARNDGAGGVGNVPATATDAGGSGGGGMGGAPSRYVEAASGGVQGAPSDPTVQSLPMPDPPAPSATAPTGIRGGGEIRQVGEGIGGSEPQAPRPRFAKVGGKDIRAGFTVQKSALDPGDIEDAELAEADASIERKLGAQNIAGRRATQAETLSAELGRQLKAEGVAIRQQEERNRAQLEDFQSRQRAIEDEREQVAKLNVTPADLVGEGGLTGIVAALTLLAAAPAAAYNGGRNYAKEAIQNTLDRRLAKAKEKVAGKESDFERLVRIYGSPAEAEAELRDRQRLFVQRLGEKMTTDAGALDAADALRMQFADWDDERAQSRLARQQALAGNVTEQWAYQPFGVGGGRPVSETDVQKLAKAREEAGIGEAEGDAAEIQDLISELPEGELPTPGSRNVLSRGARAVVDFVGGEGSAAESFDSDAERAAAAKFSRNMNTLKSKFLGAARSPAEIADFQEGFANVRTKEGMQQFAADWQRKIKRREAGVKAGFRDEVVETFEERQRSRQPTRRPSGLRSE